MEGNRTRSLVYLKLTCLLKSEQCVVLLPFPQDNDRFTRQIFFGQNSIDPGDAAIVDVRRSLGDVSSGFALASGQSRGTEGIDDPDPFYQTDSLQFDTGNIRKDGVEFGVAQGFDFRAEESAACTFRGPKSRFAVHQFGQRLGEPLLG